MRQNIILGHIFIDDYDPILHWYVKLYHNHQQKIVVMWKAKVCETLLSDNNDNLLPTHFHRTVSTLRIYSI